MLKNIKRSISFILAGIMLLSGCSPEDDKIIAYVKTDAEKQKHFDITYGEFMAEYRFNISGQGLDETNPDNSEEISEIKRTIIDYLTAERIRLQIAEDMGVGISSLTVEEQDEIIKNSKDVLERFTESFFAEAEAMLDADADEAAINRKAEELSEKYFSDSGLSSDIVYDWQRNWIVEQKLVDEITKDVTVDENEADTIINNYAEEAKNEYENNPAFYNTMYDYLSFYLPENSRIARIILIAFAEERIQQLSNLRAVDDNENADRLREEFSVEIKEKTDEAYEKLSTGSFSDVAEEYSDAVSDAGTEDYPDGYIITPGSEYLGSLYNVGSDFINTFYEIGEAGGYGEPFLTDYGYFIVEYAADAQVDEHEIEYIRGELLASLLDNAKSVKVAELELQWNETYPYYVDYKAIGLEESVG